MRAPRVLILLFVLFGAVAVLAEASADASTSVPPGFSTLSAEDEVKVKASAETFKFETEVNRMMKLIINSVYKSKEIFLRELISNASDAIDKIRFLALTNKKELDSASDLKITIVADKEKKTLTITDTGVGMTKKGLKDNLGTIAKSGTSEFLTSMEGNATADTNLIGQFGVGFYSVFLVADSVTVVSKHNEDKQYVWESTSENDFRIVEDPRGNTLGRGTQITLHLKEEALTYLNDKALRDLIHRYSEFINFPIYLWSSKTTSEEVPVDEDDEPETADADIEDVVDEDAKPKTKFVEKTAWDWELMNENKPIWTRRPSEVNEEEYTSFYKTFAKDTSAPLSYIHFRAEGEVDFRAMLFIPKSAPASFMQSSEEVLRSIKLFVRRVFITDEMSDLLPRYLAFLKGLVDSDDLPLNVSRETLQQHSILKVIRKKLIAKALEMFRNLATSDPEKYLEFYAEYGAALKVGVIEDRSNKNKLTKLLRFRSSASGEEFISLETYVARMKQGQKQIYFVTGEDIETLKKSPFVEKLIARGYEVLYMADPVDEYLSQSLDVFDGRKFQHVGK
ncbi:Hsp90 protein-domain-containing protein, partial [Blyttiomyces helicus]